jgi:hypothetical protein
MTKCSTRHCIEACSQEFQIKLMSLLTTTYTPQRTTKDGEGNSTAAAAVAVALIVMMMDALPLCAALEEKPRRNSWVW